MSTIDRRAVISGAAAAIAAVPALAASPALSAGFPDLAARFTALYPLWRDRKNADHARLVDFWSRVEAETGFGLDDSSPRFDEPGGPEFAATRDRIYAEHRARYPREEGEDHFWDEMHDELFPLAEEILRRRARTLADLGLQAQVSAVVRDEWWTSHHGQRYIVDRCARVMVESICAFAGVETLPGIDYVIPIKWEDEQSASDATGAAS